MEPLKGQGAFYKIFLGILTYLILGVVVLVIVNFDPLNLYNHKGNINFINSVREILAWPLLLVVYFSGGGR